MAIFDSNSPGLLGKAGQWMTPERGLALAGLGQAFSQLGAGQPVDLSSAHAALQQRRERQQAQQALQSSGLMEKFSPEQRAILAQMEPSAAQKIIASVMFAPPPDPVNLQTFQGPDGRVYQFNPRTGETAPLTGAKPDDPKVPTTKNVTLGDGSEVMVQWNPETQVWDPAPIPEGGASAQPIKKLTESQSKLTLFQSMQEETAPVLEQLEEQWDPANIPDAIARNTPIAGNFYKSPQGQIYESASAAWAEGALRIATGAAAQQQEIERTQKTYFAQAGDLPATVAFKREMRGMYVRAIQRALGEGKVEGELILPMDFAEQFGTPETATPEAAAPEAATSDFLTEEERKFLGLD